MKKEKERRKYLPEFKQNIISLAEKIRLRLPNLLSTNSGYRSKAVPLYFQQIGSDK